MCNGQQHWLGGLVSERHPQRVPHRLACAPDRLATGTQAVVRPSAGAVQDVPAGRKCLCVGKGGHSRQRMKQWHMLSAAAAWTSALSSVAKAVFRRHASSNIPRRRTLDRGRLRESARRAGRRMYRPRWEAPGVLRAGRACLEPRWAGRMLRISRCQSCGTIAPSGRIGRVRHLRRPIPRLAAAKKRPRTRRARKGSTTMALMPPAQDFLGGGSPTPLFAPAVKGGNRCLAPSSLFFFRRHEIGDHLTVAGDRDALAGLGDAQKFGETRLGVGGGDLHVADCPSDRTRSVVCGFDGVTSRLDMPEPNQ